MRILAYAEYTKSQLKIFYPSLKITAANSRVMDGGAVARVAHGYFNAMIGRHLRRRGWSRTGSHRARYWNAVIYDWKKGEAT